MTTLPTTTSLPIRPTYAPVPSVFHTAGPSIEALYLHVPFCSSKCHYCDFYSLAGHLHEADAFLDALDREASLWHSIHGTLHPSTIFIGGGTPTLLSPAQLDRLMHIIHAHISPDRLTEFTVEANPNTFDPDRAATLARHGVNRLSFGAQSFTPSELTTLQRDHDPDNVPRAFDIARAANITNLNIDLIFGIPGQTLATWEHSLASALALNPSHMSCYSLTYEPNTAMTARLNAGHFSPIDEELELAMFDHVYQRLRNADFTRYEVSNYARPGQACQHNIHYWKGAPWAAWGPSASGHIAGHRWKNAGSLTHYLDALNPAHPTLPLTQLEHLSPTAWAAEVATFWLRLAEGLNYEEFRQRTHIDARPILEPILAKYAAMNLVTLTPTRAQLTEAAIPISNHILRNVVTAFS